MSFKQKKIKPDPASYRRRDYRGLVDHGSLVSFQVVIGETDLHILAQQNFAQEAADLVAQYRTQLEGYISRQPLFLTSLTPLPLDPLAPPLVKKMMRAALAAEVGPMAAVAGGIAHSVGRELLKKSAEVMVENGGDIFLSRQEASTVAIFAGSSRLSTAIGIRLEKERMPLGVCTSSATIGHSLSLGAADAVTVLAPSVCLADAAATRLGNETKKDRPFSEILAIAAAIEGVEGVVLIRGEELGAWGDVELVSL